MIEIIKQQIAKEIDYLFTEGDNEKDRSWVEGKIDGMKWVLTQLEKEGKQ